MTALFTSSKSGPASLLILGIALGAYTACTGFIGEPGGKATARINPNRAGGTGSGTGAGSDGGSTTETGPGSLVTAHVRLLNNAEYNNTVAALLGDSTQPANAFPPPSSQLGFTNNAAQVVGSLLAGAVDSAAQTLAADAVQSLSTLLPCDPAAAGEDACAAQFVDDFGARAFRRPLTDDDRSGLVGVYSASRQHGADFPTAIQNVLYAILSSGSFLYITELGTDQTSGATTTLTPYEVATALSYFIIASPPDSTLVAAAASGSLSTPDQLEQQARRLLSDPRAHAQVGRFVREWFEIQPTTKDPTTYPDYSSVSQSALAETPALIDDVIFKGDGTLKSLLLADYTFVDSTLAQYYGLPDTIPDGQTARVSLAGSNRMGILTHASFLATHGDQATSSPIKRGVFVRRRLLCDTLPPPPANLDTTPPSATAAKTTRQLFDAHIAKPACSGCHSQIEPLGNGFEHFDGAGHYRTTDNGQPVDATGEVTGTPDADGKFDGVLELARRLAPSKDVNACFARQVFRFASAQNGKATEQEFLNELPAKIPDSLQDIVVAYVRTAMFGKRLVP